VLDPLLLAGEIATCGVLNLEVLYTASSPPAYRNTARWLSDMPRALLDEKCMERAMEVQAMLAERFQHRGVSLPDLLIAACAECRDLTVLHYDADYDRIAELTDQPTRWVVPRGSVS
jgi:predicted nucleic acid-binding protein